MKSIINNIKNNMNSIFFIFLLILFFIILTYINQNFIKSSFAFEAEVYKNDLVNKIDSNNISDIDYKYLLKDLDNIDIILKEQLSLDLDKNRKSKYYAVAENVYTNKINEITRILNEKLDDEDFERLLLDLDDFQKNIDFAIEDIQNKLESSTDIKLYINKYLYEEKQKKCREVLETYKGFLQ